jgi:hypothetical protein
VLTVAQVFELAARVGRRPVGNVRQLPVGGYRLQFRRDGVMRTVPAVYATRDEAESALRELADTGRADCTHDRRYHALILLTTFASLRWGERAADDTVAMLRTEAGRDPYDKSLTGLVGDLSTRSDEFRVRWGAHDVQLHRTGLKHMKHPVVGELHLSYEVMELSADPGLDLIAFSAEAGSPADDALRLLASWAATHAPANT